MKTDKLQRLESLDDLESLKVGDIIETESHGIVAYYESIGKMKVFIARGKISSISNLTIDPTLNHVIDKGKITFRSAYYTQITPENHDKEAYESQNKMLTDLEL